MRLTQSGVPTTLAYVILFVVDIDRSVRLHRDVIGRSFRFTSDSYAEFRRKARFAL